MDKMEMELKDFFHQERNSLVSGQRSDPGYPEVEDFYLFLTDKLTDEALRKMLEHLKRHPEDQALVAKAREILEAPDETDKEIISSRLLEKAKALVSEVSGPLCPHCGQPITLFKKPVERQKAQSQLWLLTGIVAFILSYVFHRYFIQCLVISLLAMVKWIVDQRAIKTKIMIYKALAEDSAEKSKDLHRIGSRL